MAANFAFVVDPKLRRIAKRDFYELRRLRRLKVPKARIIAAGSLIEGMLLDAVMRRKNRLNAAFLSKKQKPVAEWGLNNLLDAALELELISENSRILANSIREFRNLVHPGLEARKKFVVSDKVAQIADDVALMIIVDLRSAHKERRTRRERRQLNKTNAQVKTLPYQPKGDKGTLYKVLGDGEWHRIPELQSAITKDVKGRLRSLRGTGKANGQFQIEIAGDRARMIKPVTTAAAAASSITGKTFGEIYPLSWDTSNKNL